MIVLFLGCAKPAAEASSADRGMLGCVELRVATPTLNHPMPWDAEVDADRRRVYVTSVASETLAVVDPDAGTLLEVLLPGPSFRAPEAVVDGLGRVWMADVLGSSIVSIDPDTYASVNHGPVGDRITGMVARPEGGVALTRERGRVEWWDASGALEHSVALAGSPADVATAPDGSLAVLEWDAEGVGFVELVSTEGVLERCDVDVPGIYVAVLDDGAVMVADFATLAVAGCGGRAPASLEMGWYIGDILSLGDTVLTLDRVGSSLGEDPNAGLARTWNASLEEVAEPFATGHHVRSGDVDPATGWLWTNEECLSSATAYDPALGVMARRVPTGHWLDGFAVHPEEPSTIVATGRLGNTLVRLEGDEVVASRGDIQWPHTPAIDPVRREVWVNAHSDSILHVLDLDTLATVRVVDLDFDPNPWRVFSTLAWHPARGTMFFAESAIDVVYELDPATGAVLGSWELGGAETWFGAIAQYSLFFPEDDPDLVWVARTRDARVSKLRLDTGELAHVTLGSLDPDEEGIATEDVGTAYDSAGWIPELGRIYVGGRAVDLETLAADPAADLDVNLVVGPHPANGDEIVAISADFSQILHLASDGTVLGSLQMPEGASGAGRRGLDAASSRVLVASAVSASLCAYGAEEIE